MFQCGTTATYVINTVVLLTDLNSFARLNLRAHLAICQPYMRLGRAVGWAMAVLESPVTAPDAMGLPEYRVTEMYTEIDGNDIRMAFGTKRFGHVEWLYTVVVSPEKLLKFCHHCEMVALEVFNMKKMAIERDRGH